MAGGLDGAGSAAPSRGRLIVFWLLLALLLLGAAELGAAALCRAVLLTPARFAFWRPDPAEARRLFPLHAAEVDEELGWPSRTELFSSPRDKTGAKENPDFPDPERACASAYGDSFIWGDEVPLASGWIEQLSRLLGCRVSNFGVSAYGTDQALVRFRRNVQDHAPVVLLGIYPENIERNVNHFRPLLFGNEPDPRWLKGRFVVGAAGDLGWVPRPTLDAEAFARLQRAPETFLPHEYYLPGGPDGPIPLGFPNLAALGRMTALPRVRTRLNGRAPWAGLYRPDHPSGALGVTIAIAKTLAAEAGARGQRALVVMLPGNSSFRHRERTGGFEYASLTEALTRAGVDVVDGGERLLAALGGRSYCELMSNRGSCSGHYGELGSTLMAETMAADLRARGVGPR